jgi:hypothetical protein
MNAYNVFRAELANCQYVDAESPIIESLIEFRCRLLDQGYEPIPVAGKGGLLDKWTEGPITEVRIELESRVGTGKLNTGFRTGRLVGVDNDIRDPEHAALIDEVVEIELGATGAKRRGSKGCMAVYWNRNPIHKLTLTAKDGTRLFEVLGTGQQFVGYGQPCEGVWYEWVGDQHPFVTPIEELPEVTGEQLRQLINSVREVLVELGYEFKPERVERDPNTDRERTYDSDEPDIVELCRAALQVIPNDLDRENWVTMCYAMHDAGLDYSDWLAFCHKWSGSHAPGSVERTWRSCSNTRSVSFRTILWRADEIDPEWRSLYYQPIRETRRQSYEAWARDQEDDYRSTMRAERGDTAEEAEQTGESEPEAQGETTQTGSETWHGSETQTDGETVWPEPLPIFGALNYQPIITPEMLPSVIRDYVYDQSELLGCDPGAMAIAALAICSSLITDAITIQPKRFDTTYRECARLWLMLVGQISNKKTPMLKKLTETIRTVQSQMKQCYDHEKERYRTEMMRYEDKKRKWVGKDCQGDEPVKPEKPKECRLLTNDYTNEALADILCDNPRGILILMDEIMALFGGFDAYKSGKVNKDRPVTLEGYNGGPKDIDRKGSKDDRIHVPNWSFSIVGGIQETKLNEVGHKLGDDGLLQRFIMMPMEPPRTGVDRPPDLRAMEEFDRLVKNLIGNNPNNPRAITLSEDAHKYRELIDDLVEAFETFPGVSDPFRAYAGKFGGTFARLLLTMHMIETCPTVWFSDGKEMNVVAEETAHQTFELMTKFLIPHAIRQYAKLDMSWDQAAKDGMSFADFILAHNLTEVNKRVIMRASKRFSQSGRADKIARYLEDAFWINKGQVNPRVHEIFAQRAEYERKARKEAQERIIKGRETISEVYG